MDRDLLKIHAKHYHSLGLNVTCISHKINEFNFLKDTRFKIPSHRYEHLQTERQTQEELENYDWSNAIGVGMILGFDNYIALDIDGCHDFRIIKYFCKILELDPYYEWVAKSGSGCGFHIIMKCNNIFLEAEKIVEIKKSYPYESNDTFWTEDDFKIHGANAYYPKYNFDYDLKCESKYYQGTKELRDSDFYDTVGRIQSIVQKIEFRWKDHLVLPPSLHQCGLNYQFLNKTPLNPPKDVDFDALIKLKILLCEDKAMYSQHTQKEIIFYKDVEKNKNEIIEKHNTYLIFDTETNGIVKKIDKASSASAAVFWPRLLQLSWIIVDSLSDKILKKECHTIKISEFTIDEASTLIHGISTEVSLLIGESFKTVLLKFLEDVEKVSLVVAHNFEFDCNVLYAEFDRTGLNKKILSSKKSFCTMARSVEVRKLQPLTTQYKYPSLEELYFYLFKKNINIVHSSFSDVIVTKACYEKLSVLIAQEFQEDFDTFEVDMS